jgi:hypothetical protein
VEISTSKRCFTLKVVSEENSFLNSQFTFSREVKGLFKFFLPQRLQSTQRKKKRIIVFLSLCAL